jgi:hypothetical protein
MKLSICYEMFHINDLGLLKILGTRVTQYSDCLWAGYREFLLCHHFQISSGGQWVLRDLFTGRKSLWGDAVLLPLYTSADVKNMWSCFSTHPYIILECLKVA